MAWSHDVSVSRVKVTQSDNMVEIVQTTPVTIAHRFVDPNLVSNNTGVQLDMKALHEMAEYWEISTDKGKCTVKRRGYRRIHHDSQLQFLYSFRCPERAGPPNLVMNWLALTPSEHFILLNVDTPTGRKTRRIERPFIAFKLDGSLSAAKASP